MKRDRAGGRADWLILAWLASSACVHAPEVAPQGDPIQRLEDRVARLEMSGADHPSPSPSPSGPASARAARLREAADLLEKAEAARRDGDPVRARELFASAIEQVGAPALSDLEPVFRPSATAGPAEKTPTPLKSEAAPGTKMASKGKELVSRAARERVSFGGTMTLEGPYASAHGIGMVFLSPLASKVSPTPRRFVLQQHNRNFIPHVLSVPVGSTVAFANGDPVFHNIFSLSEAKSFDLGVYKDGESREVLFDRPGTVRILCNLHSDMSAYVVVHEEPYAVATDESGRFSFKDLPPGRYRLRAWHERSRSGLSKEVNVESGASSMALSVVADLAPSAGPNKQGKPRDSNPQPY